MLATDDISRLVADIAPQIARAPLPAPVLRVGAMGHRQLPPGSEPSVVAATGRVLEAIHAAAAAALAEPKVAARFAGELELVLNSPLAEGADQIIAAAGAAAGYKMGAILPFAIADYERTFDLAEAGRSLQQLRAFVDAAERPRGYGVFVLDGDPAPAKRDSAFLVCAAQVTHWSEIVVAILATERLELQTGQSVRDAIDTGMPVICIDPASDTTTLFLDSVRVPDAQRDARLAGAVRAFFATPDAHAGGHHTVGLADYCAERVTCDASRTTDLEYRGPFAAHTVAPVWARWGSGLNRTIERALRKKAPAPARPADPPPTAADLPFSSGQTESFVRLFLHFHRADVLANAYAEIYRSTHLLIAALGVATVALGALGAVLGTWPPLFSGFEFFSFVFALLLVWISNRQAWLARWTNYRLLAEIFRYAKFLFVAGRPSPFGDSAVAYQVWTRDHTEHVLRTYGLAVPGRGRTPDPAAVATARRYILGQCIDDQVRFHQANVPARQRMASLLREVSNWLSVVTVLVLGIKFGAELLMSAMPALLSPRTMAPLVVAGDLLAIVLPALTAAVLALRAYGEHDVVAKRSMAMIESLGHERRRVAAAANLDALGAATMRTARTLLSEVGGWVDLFVDKHLEA